MRTTRPPVVDGLSLALQAASSDTSTYTTETIHASYAIVPDFFNSLLVLLRHKCFRCDGAAIGVLQHGHRGRLLTSVPISRRRMVAIEFGM